MFRCSNSGANRALAALGPALVGLFLAAAALSAAEPPEPSPPPPRPAPDRPVEVAVELVLNKVSHVDTVEETFGIDAYLVSSWLDPAGAARLARTDGQRTVFLGMAVEEILGAEIWSPNLEVINRVGDPGFGKRSLEVEGSGRITLTERFRVTLSTDLDFRRFPFDDQVLKVHVESFTYADETLIFTEPRLTLGHIRDAPPSDWDLSAPRTRVTQTPYETGDFNRAAFLLDAARRPGYFVWQVFLPLFLILGTSWIVFWIDAFSDRLSVAFTCLLTLVAFNFYTSTLLPQLPYNTFIEAVLITAYLATFALIAHLLMAERSRASGREERSERLVRGGRWLFPVAYVVLLAAVTVSFFG